MFGTSEHPATMSATTTNAMSQQRAFIAGAYSANPTRPVSGRSARAGWPHDADVPS
jgi:hypothetical protein